MRESQPMAIMGTSSFEVMAKWWVKTRSNKGAVMMAAAIPVRSNAAPINPLVSAEYPTGA
jgi:hypothetical protein